MHDQQAGEDQQQWQHQARPAHPVFTAAATIEQIGAERDHDRQGADDQGRQGGTRKLDGAGEAGVIEQVADECELRGLYPVSTTQLRQCAAVEPGQAEREQTECEVAADGEHEAWIVAQHQRREKHQPPQQAGTECGDQARGHGLRVSDGREYRSGQLLATAQALRARKFGTESKLRSPATKLIGHLVKAAWPMNANARNTGPAKGRARE